MITTKANKYKSLMLQSQRFFRRAQLAQLEYDRTASRHAFDDVLYWRGMAEKMRLAARSLQVGEVTEN